MKMVEHVARAIFASVNARDEVRRVSWADLEADEREFGLAMARAAIEAMREPTETMQRAGFTNNKHTNANPCDRPTCIGRITMPADKAWRAMIDASLNENE